MGRLAISTSQGYKLGYILNRMKSVTWIDSSIIEQQTDEVAKPCKIVTVGHFVHESEDYIVIARDKVGSEWRGQIAIPKVCILEESE